MQFYLSSNLFSIPVLFTRFQHIKSGTQVITFRKVAATARIGWNLVLGSRHLEDFSLKARRIGICRSLHIVLTGSRSTWQNDPGPSAWPRNSDWSSEKKASLTYGAIFQIAELQNATNNAQTKFIGLSLIDIMPFAAISNLTLQILLTRALPVPIKCLDCKVR